MMIIKLMKIRKKGGEVTVTSAPGNERMSQDAANLTMLFMPAILFTHCMYRCNLTQEGVIQRYFQDISMILEKMKNGGVVVISSQYV